MAQGVAHAVVVFLGVGDKHDAPDAARRGQYAGRFGKQVGHFFRAVGLYRTYEKLAQVVAEGLAVELGGIVARGEVVHRGLRAVVDKHHLNAVGSFAQPSVEGYAVYPPGCIGLGNAASYHPLEIDNEVEGHLVGVVAVDKYNVLAPAWLVCVEVHSANLRYFCILAKQIFSCFCVIMNMVHM